MDIIDAHRQGLIEKLDVECVDLAGRPREFGQRAIVLHHLYDHSLGGHVWALVEAGRQMAADRALQAVEGKVDRWWRRRPARDEARAALHELRIALGEEAARRAAKAYRAYRIAGTPALVDTLLATCAADHADWLVSLHAARRDGHSLTAAEAHALAMAVEQDVGWDRNGVVAAARAKLDATVLAKAARQALALPTFEAQLAKGMKKGWAKQEKALREDERLPAAFRANPAQHFYALQHGLADRRRREWVDGESALAA